MSTRLREATEGQGPPTRRQVSAPPEPADHPDPVTLCKPTYDDAGLLRWGSQKY